MVVIRSQKVGHQNSKDQTSDQFLIAKSVVKSVTDVKGNNNHHFLPLIVGSQGPSSNHESSLIVEKYVNEFKNM